MDRIEMKIKALLLSTFCTIFLAGNQAHSETVTEGKEGFAVCNACHNPSLNPPLAPPMWGVQRRYKMMANDKDHFIGMVTQFAKAPTIEKAIFKNAVTKMGLMPEVQLTEDNLRKVAAYIWEEKFPPPCKHWEIGAQAAEKAGDTEHANKDRIMLERFCR